MEFDLLKDKTSIIKVIGVGGGGSNAVNHMYRQGIKGVEFFVCNTDAQALEVSPVPAKIQLGLSLTEGRGAGSMPEVGRNAAIENIDELKKILGENTKMVFITAGMGGGTGTGAAPIIAQAAKEMGILTVGIVTVPFLFEGKKRKHQADLGIEELKKNVDTLLIICNDKLREMYGNLKLGEAFNHADDILTIAAKGIAEIITVTGYINVDFEDVKTVMTNSGRAIMGSAVANGDNRATIAVQQALASPLLDDSNIIGARYILMNIASGSNEVTMDEIGNITDYIQDEAGLTADIIWGNCHDESLGDKLSVTIIATGFKTKTEQEVEAERTKKIVHDLNGETRKEVKAAPVSRNELKEPTLVNQNEPVLITKQKQDDLTFEFEIGGETAKDSISTPMPEKMNEPLARQEKKVHTLNENVSADPIDEQLRKSRERIQKLKALNYRMANNTNVSDMEKVPAYLRKEVKLDNIPHSSEPHVSRYTLSAEDEKKPELRQNNSYLHDNVD
ncbi:hypothetical protein BH11BAC1_BH11BAC1_29750 [soil metagenome]